MLDTPYGGGAQYITHGWSRKRQAWRPNDPHIHHQHRVQPTRSTTDRNRPGGEEPASDNIALSDLIFYFEKQSVDYPHTADASGCSTNLPWSIR